jgi:hypothetical protein
LWSGQGWKLMCRCMRQCHTYMTKTNDRLTETTVSNSEEKRSQIWRQSNRWDNSPHQWQVGE